MNGLTRAWRVWLSDAARLEMASAAAAAHPSETGGVLVGVVLGRGRGAGRPWVTHAVEVRSRTSGPSHYELPAGARKRVVKRLRRNDPRLGYLGECMVLGGLHCGQGVQSTPYPSQLPLTLQPTHRFWMDAGGCRFG